LTLFPGDDALVEADSILQCAGVGIDHVGGVAFAGPGGSDIEGAGGAGLGGLALAGGTSEVDALISPASKARL
jgi:hypothetical protein